MNTKITITLNGSIAPKQKFQLGYKYENLGDTITFIIPTKYFPYHHYLALQRILSDEEIADEVQPVTLLLPVNISGGELKFIISNAITRNPGEYKMVFLSTENKVVDGDIQEAHQVFVSNEFIGYVLDNFLTDPINDEPLDPNLQIIYDDLLNLRNELEQKLVDDYYRGDYYLPNVDEHGWVSWEIKEGRAEFVPAGRNITGPQGIQGGYYTPIQNTENAYQLDWQKSQDNLPTVASVDLEPLIKQAADGYLNTNLAGEVDRAVDAKFKWVWDAETASFYIFTNSVEYQKYLDSKSAGGK